MEDSGFSAFLPTGVDASGRGSGTIVANDVDRLIDVIESGQNGAGPSRPRTPMKAPSIEIDFDDRMTGSGDEHDENDARSSMSDIEPIRRRGSDIDESDSVVSLRPNAQPRQPAMDRETMLRTKQDLLYKLNRMRARGHPVPQFTMESDFEDIKNAFDEFDRARGAESAIAMQRKAVLTTASGIEWVTGRFFPEKVRLSGWSETIRDELPELDEIFEELYEKYRTRGRMPPEVRLLFAVVGSAVTTHMVNSVLGKFMPDTEQVMKANPELRRQFATASANVLGANASAAGNNIAAKIASDIGAYNAHSPAAARTMRGPSDFGSMLTVARASHPPPPTPPPAQPSMYPPPPQSVHSDDGTISLSNLSLSSGRRVLQL